MVTRRNFLRMAGAAATVVGFDPLRRTWVLAGAGGPLHEAPPLDGTLHLDTATRRQDARDQGNIVTEIPAAVLRPGSVEDIAKMIRFCRERSIPVAPRGQGHTTHGQGLAGGGLIIESRPLKQIHSISPRSAEVSSGALWRELLEATLPHSLTPPVLTGYIALSVGGTLSVGGVSSTNGRGLQIDRIRELEVVTGAGDVVRCSPAEHRELFEAVLGGVGQFGVITRATTELVPAPSRVRTYWIHYLDNAAFFRDLRTLLDRGEFDDLYCEWHPNGTALLYRLVAAVGYEPSQPPDQGHLLRGLTVPPFLAVPTDQTYRDWALRVDVQVALLQLTGWDRLVKPWFDVWLPDSTVEEYVGRVIPTVGPFDVGVGFVLLFPQRRSQMTRPFFSLPEADGSDWVYLFDILTSSLLPGPSPPFARRMLDRNRRLYDLAAAAGATRYPIGALEFTGSDWMRQYGSNWDELVRRKRLFDPDGILTPGPGIFP
jgi:cytokinin dehydrogenase